MEGHGDEAVRSEAGIRYRESYNIVCKHEKKDNKGCGVVSDTFVNLPIELEAEQGCGPAPCP